MGDVVQLHDVSSRCTRDVMRYDNLVTSRRFRSDTFDDVSISIMHDVTTRDIDDVIILIKWARPVGHGAIKVSWEFRE